ncbi:MAG: hypothetical protein J5933_05915, partial [Clostridia bacterium]|nr:hypothetical protein [Clostridia bacterium]
EFQRNTYTENGWKMSIVYDKNVRPLPYDKRKGSRYNDAIKAYNEFIMSYRSYGKSIDTIVQEYNEASEERKSSYRFQKYGLADMNRDGIPELVVSKPLSVMQLFTYADGEVTSLECTTESGWHGFRGIMKSGYSRGNHVSTQNDWTFYKYNRDLSVETITFGVYWPPLYGDYVNSNLRYWETDLYTDLKLSLHMNGDSFGLYIFVFNGRVVSEREYQQLTKPYIDMTDSSYQVDCRYSQVGIADYEYPYFVKQENRHEFYAL